VLNQIDIPLGSGLQDRSGRSVAAAIVGLTIAATPIVAQDLKTTVSKIELNDGDTLVFLGDSITHQCLYTQYVEDFFYTRFPNKRIKFHNAGVSGDRNKDALVRFDRDVASFKPKYVTILLGSVCLIGMVVIAVVLVVSSK